MATASSTYEVKLEMLTWNIASSKSGKYFAELRHSVVPTVKQQLSDGCISFLQEIAINLEGVTKWGFPNTVASTFRGKKDAGVSIPSTALGDQIKLACIEPVTDEDLKVKWSVPKEYAERLYGQMVNISTNDSNPLPHYISDVTILSYHAAYKTKEKQKKTKRFFEEMCKLADNLNTTIIIGGDFNLSILDVKTQVDKLEASWTEESGYKYKGRIIVALYMPTPRRRCDNCIDTFAIVHPTSREHRTECQFEKTVPIYPFPMTTHQFTADQQQESVLSAYPPYSAHPWFKYVVYGELQGTESNQETYIKGILEKKKKWIKDKLEEENKKEYPEFNEEKIKSLTEELEESEKWLSQPYTEEYKGHGPPAPLWPYSPLHQVLDHDPVVTTLKIKLKPILR